MNAGGKKAVLWGTALDNLASWRMVDAAGAMARGGAPRPQPAARSTMRRWRASASGASPPTATPCSPRTLLEIPGRRLRKEGLGKDVTDKFLAGLPGHPEGRLRRAHHVGDASSCTGCRRIRARCAWNSSATCSDAVPAIVEIKRLPRRAAPAATARRPGAPRRALREGGRLRHQGASAAGCRRWCCSATSSATTRTRSARPPPQVVRIANARGGEGFVAVSAEARKHFWLDRARTAAIARHTNAFKINEDVVIPLERLGDYTDGIERINIELSIAQQAGAARCAGRIPARASCRRSAGDETANPRRQAECVGDRAVARALAAGVGARPRRAAGRRLPRAHRRCGVLRAAAGAHARRVSWKREILAAAAPHLRRRRLRAAACRRARRSTRRCCAAACSWRCTCTPATATCTPTSRSTPTTTRCCTRRTRRWRASCASPRAWAA